jgi:hypothetical protein
MIVDWAGNILNYRGRFNSPQFAVPMLFDSFDDGWDWISVNMDEDQRSDVYVQTYLNFKHV